MQLDEQLRKLATCGEYWDSLGCPQKPDQNSGDLVHRCGTQALELYLATADDPNNPAVASGRNARLRSSARRMFTEQLKAHYCGDGNFKRGHSVTFLHHDPNRPLVWPTWDRVFSRDQSIAVIIGCAVFGMVEWIDRIEKGLDKRGGFYTNRVINGQPDSDKTPDLATPPIYGLLDRARGIRKINGRIQLGDDFELADSRLLEATHARPKVWDPFFKKWRFPLGRNKLHGDPVNKTLVLLYTKMTIESRNGELARQIYASKIDVWGSWLKYWDRGVAVKRNGRMEVESGDPQCPFHLFFEPFIHALGKDTLL